MFHTFFTKLSFLKVNNSLHLEDLQQKVVLFFLTDARIEAISGFLRKEHILQIKETVL